VSPVPSTIGASATSLPIRMAPITCAPWAASNGHGELGVAAGSSRAARVGGHLLAEPFRAHRLADRYDLPAYPVTRNIRGPDGEVAAAGARPDHRVDKQDVAGRGSDQDLFRSRRGIGQVSKLKHERQPEVAHFDSPHGDQPPSAPSVGPMSRASKPG